MFILTENRCTCVHVYICVCVWDVFNVEAISCGERETPFNTPSCFAGSGVLSLLIRVAVVKGLFTISWCM